jgi:nucleoid-associated protein YgaU
VSVLAGLALVAGACTPSPQRPTEAGRPATSAVPPELVPGASPVPSPSPRVFGPPPSPAASPAASPSPTLAPGEQAYTVEAGDTLGSIAQKFYGDSSQWRKIYDANRSALGDNPDAIKPGTQIRIPPKD